jgi:hypothetical protein
MRNQISANVCHAVLPDASGVAARGDAVNLSFPSLPIIPQTKKTSQILEKFIA